MFSDILRAWAELELRAAPVIQCIGPSGAMKSASAGETGAANTLTGAGTTALGTSTALQTEVGQLQAPLIKQETALASGDPKAALSAFMGTGGGAQVSSGYEASKAKIMNNVPPGAARDQALAQLETQKATAIGGGEASAVQNAPSVLANLAGQQEQAALGYLNAGTGATANAANVFGTVYNQAQAQQAEALNFISSLAGVAGSALTGGMGGVGILSALTKNTTKPVTTPFGLTGSDMAGLSGTP